VGQLVVVALDVVGLFVSMQGEALHARREDEIMTIAELIGAAKAHTAAVATHKATYPSHQDTAHEAPPAPQPGIAAIAGEWLLHTGLEGALATAVQQLLSREDLSDETRAAYALIAQAVLDDETRLPARQAITPP
jgi:hypothetical protein